jgi:peptidoglycan/xylan/chitin deacetylase (PgdA/CDA1 family)
LATQHEIGAHTLTHPDLRQLPPQEQLDEITGSKQWLEKVLGKEIKMFCYPKGLYSETVIHTVQTAGFMGARTTQLGSLSTSANSFTLPTTLQIYPFPFRKLTQHQYYWQKLFEPYQQRATALQYLGVSLFSMHSWLSTAKATFDAALKRGGIFHLWGHSWEIEKYGMWEDLEQLCAYITQYPQCKHLTNSETLS